MTSDVIETSTTEKEATFFNNFSTERFFYEDLGIDENDIEDLKNTSFFSNFRNIRGIFYESTTDQILNGAIQNSTNGKLETPNVLLYLRDNYRYTNSEGNEFFYSLFTDFSFSNLKESLPGNYELSSKEFLSLILLSYINDFDLQIESKERIQQGEEPSEVFPDLVRRRAEVASKRR